MKTKLIFITSLVLLTSCSNQPSGQPSSATTDSVTSESTSESVERTSDITPDTEGGTGDYIMPFYPTPMKSTFKASSYDIPASTYSKEIAMNAYDFAMACDSQATLDAFYRSFGFENPFYPQRYIDGKHEKLSCHYGIAGKKMNGFYLVNISIDGNTYQEEWYDNFVIGKEGEHYGYKTAADKLYVDLKAYLDTLARYKLRVMISGFSRAGAIAELVGSMLTDDCEQYEMDADDIFVYSFEAAMSVPSHKEYANIHHVYSREDYVPRVPPGQYGFAYVGTPHDIYTDSYPGYVKERFGVEYAAFSPTKAYPDRKSVYDKLFEMLLEPHKDDPDALDVSTREKYVDKIQESLARLMSKIISQEMEKIEAAIKEMGDVDFLSVISTEKKATDFMKKFIAALGAEDYSDAEIETDVHAIYPAISTMMKYHLADLLTFGPVFKDNAEAIGCMHMPHVVYSMLFHS